MRLGETRHAWIQYVNTYTTDTAKLETCWEKPCNVSNEVMKSTVKMATRELWVMLWNK